MFWSNTFNTWTNLGFIQKKRNKLQWITGEEKCKVLIIYTGFVYVKASIITSWINGFLSHWLLHFVFELYLIKKLKFFSTLKRRTFSKLWQQKFWKKTNLVLTFKQISACDISKHSIITCSTRWMLNYLNKTLLNISKLDMVWN
jgi:hypothetical protein